MLCSHQYSLVFLINLSPCCESSQYRAIRFLELSARQQSSPQPVHRKLVMQPLQTSVDVGTFGQLQRDNVDLKRQLHEQNDIILALRRDLAGANARLSDITGTCTCTCNVMQAIVGK